MPVGIRGIIRASFHPAAMGGPVHYGLDYRKSQILPVVQILDDLFTGQLLDHAPSGIPNPQKGFTILVLDVVPVLRYVQSAMQRPRSLGKQAGCA